ncbi:hypothetical protein AAFF_G00289090 [Aldrovandia affinis]|uniref:Uncharacterized protein n=1 Tax=Aldrovandia affinis TaxID=143900 RepID=A0AAD7R9M7_9TELE|nr:hypothetical protein AAFF_G00289090 [Aldrovandia affinis]
MPQSSAPPARSFYPRGAHFEISLVPLKSRCVARPPEWLSVPPIPRAADHSPSGPRVEVFLLHRGESLLRAGPAQAPTPRNSPPEKIRAAQT